MNDYRFSFTQCVGCVVMLCYVLHTYVPSRSQIKGPKIKFFFIKMFAWKFDVCDIHNYVEVSTGLYYAPSYVSLNRTKKPTKYGNDQSVGLLKTVSPFLWNGFSFLPRPRSIRFR